MLNGYLEEARQDLQTSRVDKYPVGHLWLLATALFGLILKEKIESNLKIVSRNKLFIKKVWECNYKEILQDIDTEKDYQNLMQKKNTNI